MTFAEDAVWIEGAGIWIAVALAGIDGTDEEIEVGVEHGLGIAGAAAAIDLDKNAGVKDAGDIRLVWAKGCEGVLSPVEGAEHVAVELLAGDEVEGGDRVSGAFDFQRCHATNELYGANGDGQEEDDAEATLELRAEAGEEGGVFGSWV